MDNLLNFNKLKATDFLKPEDSIRLHFSKFLRYLLTKNRSPLTIKMYSHYLNTFLKECIYVNNLTDITVPTVIDYQEKLYLKGLSESTRNGMLVALRSFISYCSKMGLPVINPQAIDLPQIKRPETSYLTSEEIKKLLQACEIHGNAARKRDLRDRAMLEVLISSGLRVSELCNLKVDDVDLVTQEVRVINGKGSKHRLTFISKNAVLYLKRQLEKRKSKESPYLFCSTKGKGAGKQINPRSVQRMVVFYAKKAGISKECSVHTLRHSAASEWLSGGLNIREVQELLGHSNIQMTSRYTHITNPALKRAYIRAQSPFAVRSDGSLEDEKMVISKEKYAKLVGLASKGLQQNSLILKKLDKKA